MGFQVAITFYLGGITNDVLMGGRRQEPLIYKRACSGGLGASTRTRGSYVSARVIDMTRLETYVVENQNEIVVRHFLPKARQGYLLCDEAERLTQTRTGVRGGEGSG